MPCLRNFPLKLGSGKTLDGKQLSSVRVNLCQISLTIFACVKKK